MDRKTNLIGLTALLCLVSVPPLRASDANAKGMISARAGDTFIVDSAKGSVTVVLTDQTKTKDDTGLFGLGTDRMADVVLIPGLKVDVEGTFDSKGRIVAKTITVDGDDLETSVMIQAGLHPTAEQVAANVASIEANKQGVSSNSARISELEKQHQAKIAATLQQVEAATDRFNALADYNVKGEATIKFGPGSSSLTADDQVTLQKLAKTATSLKGYIIEVTGYSDSTGTPAMGTKVSEDRAKAVITFLMQRGGVPVRHILAPGVMGQYGAAASNETEAGRAENRRVVVKILVNKGIVTGG